MSRLNLRTNRVQGSFKTLQKRLSVVLRKINSEAAIQMKTGHYESAKALMEIGRSISDFSTKASDISKAWDQLASGIAAQLTDLGIPSSAPRKSTTAKTLCLPALGAVLKRGGHADMAEVISDLENAPNASWTDADLIETGSRLRWHTTLDKAYRRSQRLGWIDNRTDGAWYITEKGRAALKIES